MNPQIIKNFFLDYLVLKTIEKTIIAHTHTKLLLLLSWLLLASEHRHSTNDHTLAANHGHEKPDMTPTKKRNNSITAVISSGTGGVIFWPFKHSHSKEKIIIII